MEFSFRFSSSSPDCSIAIESNKFHLKTYFLVKRWLDDDEDEEDIFDHEMCEEEEFTLSDSSSDQLRQIINFRLKEYRMPRHKIQAILRESLRRISRPGDVVLEVTMWTAQKEGEKIDDVMERAVPECLTPALLLHKSNPLRDFVMFRVRFGGDDKSNPIIDTCPICMCGGGPTSGGCWWSTLPCCRNNFHTHCVGKWLLARPSCPLCRFDATNWAPVKFSPTPPELPPQRPRKRKLPIHDHDMPDQPPAKRSRQPSPWLRDYYVN